MSLRILHTGDLFLSSPLAGIRHVSDELAPRLATATFDAWDRFTDLAADVAADLVLVTGGLPTLPPEGIGSPYAAHAVAAQVHFAGGLERLAAVGASVVAVGSLPVGAGSPVPGGWTPPGLVHLHSADDRRTLTVSCRDGSTVSVAVNADPDAPIQPAQTANPAQTADAIVAATVASSQPRPGVELRRRISYWAFGGRGEGITYRPTADGPLFVQAGPAQPHRFPSPRGETGAVLVDIDDLGQVTAVGRLATDAVRLLTIPFDLGSADSLESLAAALNTQVGSHVATARAADRPVVARVELSGHGPSRRRLISPEGMDRFVHALRDGVTGSFFWWADALLRPLPAETAHSLAGSDPLAAELLRVAGAHGGARHGLLTQAISLSLELTESFAKPPVSST